MCLLPIWSFLEKVLNSPSKSSVLYENSAFELTVHHICNIEKRHEEKPNKYKYLETESNDYSVLTHAPGVEIRGYISKEDKKMVDRSTSYARRLEDSRNFKRPHQDMPCMLHITSTCVEIRPNGRTRHF